ncbi:MAG: hypothetical protein WB869_14285 [Candidatus Acidiferrales bacterium]
MDRRFLSRLAFLSLLLVPFNSFAQDDAPPPPSTPSTPADSVPVDASYGNAQGPLQVQSGTRFLVSLQDVLSTAVDQRGKRFALRTVEPLVTQDGTRLPAGAEIRARVSRVDAPNQTGRGRLWLTFDDIHAPGGRVPIVADLFDIPSDRSVRVGKSHEGEVESRNNSATEQAEAAAGAAAMAAFTAAKSGGKKAAALGAAAAGVTALLLAAGLGQDVVLDKETKLELILERPLTLPAR